MPLAAERRHIVLGDWPLAAAAFRREHVEVVVATERLAVLLVKALLAELLAALCAEKVLRVPCLLQRRHAFIEYGSIAVGATGREQVMIVGLAVGISVALKEVARAQLLGAVRAGEVLRMPRLAQGGDHLAHYRLVARAATALLCCVYSLSTHVCL